MRKRGSQKKFLSAGLGAGLAGAFLLAMKYALRPPTKLQVPDTISPAIFTTKVLHTSLGQVVYHEAGSGQPLIFIHGVSVGASSYEWSKVYPEFASRFRVIALDLVGFGESERPPNKRAQAGDYVKMLAEFIRVTCADEKPILIASGLGAGFSVYLASQHPELASRLILLMPTGLSDFGQQRLPFGAKMMSRVPLVNRFIYRNHLSTRNAIRNWLKTFGYVNQDLVTDETVDVFTTCAQQYGAEHSILNFYSGRLNFDLGTRMARVTQPVTLIWGTEAAFPPVEWAYRLQAMVRNTNLVIIQNGGVLAALENSMQMIRALDEQLAANLRVVKQ